MHAAMNLVIGLILIQFPFVDVLNCVEVQENIKELCKTMRDMRNDIIDLSLEEDRVLGEALLWNLSA